MEQNFFRYNMFPSYNSRKEKKENLDLKAVTMIDPVTGWFKITQYE